MRCVTQSTGGHGRVERHHHLPPKTDWCIRITRSCGSRFAEVRVAHPDTWFRKGFDSGDSEPCDTFSGDV